MVSQWCRGGVPVVLQWCNGPVSVVSRWCPSDVPVVFLWCLGGVSVSQCWSGRVRCAGGVPVVSWSFPRWCCRMSSGVSVVSRWLVSQSQWCRVLLCVSVVSQCCSSVVLVVVRSYPRARRYAGSVPAVFHPIVVLVVCRGCSTLPVVSGVPRGGDHHFGRSVTVGRLVSCW